MSWKGKTHTEEYKKAMSEKLKGRKTPWLYGKPSWNKGKKWSEESKKKMSIAKKGKKASLETRLKMSNSRKGAKTYNYKGTTPEFNKIRKSLQYQLWREAVLKRDNYTCIFCGYRKGKIHADHIKPFAHYPELRFAIDNGRTLCIPCHQSTDTYGARANRHKPK